MKRSINLKNKIAVFASGCFWGTEYYFKKTEGAVNTTVGYTGGKTGKPNYKQVCIGSTGHVEAVSIEYDPNITNYKKLAQLFFETHNFEQINGQGPDIGSQYRSIIFYSDEIEKNIAEKLIAELVDRGHKVATQIKKLNKFWPAEEHHQDYYEKIGKKPNCHTYKKIFG